MLENSELLKRLDKGDESAKELLIENNMELTNKQKGELGEILVSMELMNMGLDVVNINTVYRNR